MSMRRICESLRMSSANDKLYGNTLVEALVKLFLSIIGIAAVALLVSLALGSRNSADAGGNAQVASALGIARVGGEDVYVHVVVAVPAGEDGKEVGRRALSELGASELKVNDVQSARYAVSGLVWDQFSDSASTNDFVAQYYNPANQPSGAGDALIGSEATWTNVASSAFELRNAGTTSRCPSLVQECKGPQYFDGNNDVAWLRLSGSSILGVTWYSTARDEADMALNTRFSWYTGTGTPPSGRYDAETVFLHENGHVAGLNHSPVDGSVMEPYYEGVRRVLHQDDIDGITSLYPVP